MIECAEKDPTDTKSSRQRSRPATKGAMHMSAASRGNRVIVSVLGQDRVGIIAGVSGILAENNINILDISQTTMQGIFTMILIADMEQSRINLDTLQEKMQELGKTLGLKIVVQHEDVFRFMHRI